MSARVSVVVVGYKRPDLLLRTVTSFRTVSTYPHLEFVLSDDGSPAKMQKEMRQMAFDLYAMASRNEGLGRNINKGMTAATGEYLLLLQDDWLCRGPADFVEAGLEVLAERPDVGLVRYRRSTREPPFDLHVTGGGRRVRIYQNDSYARTGAYAYTDNPHLKRRSLHETLGMYLEGVPMTHMEHDFARRFDGQCKVKGAYIEGYDVFEHIGEEQSFNPSNRKGKLKDRLEANWMTRIPLRAYLAIKHRRK